MHIIDSDDYKASGIETLFFSGGEPHVKVPDFDDDLLLFLKLRTWNDVGIAACLLNVLETRTVVKIAFVPYFPGARQDKPADLTSPLTADIVGRLLSKRTPVVTFDIHSEKALRYSGATQNLMPSNLQIPLRDDVVGIIAPDKGALHRATSFRNKFYPEAALLECSKKRNQQTGELSDYVMPPLPESGRYIIVDDICDGGRTFNLLAEEFVKDKSLVAYGRDHTHLELFVSHGIFSRGLSNLHPAIEHITTTDSWCRMTESNGVKYMNGGIWSDRLTVLPLAQLFPSFESK